LPTLGEGECLSLDSSLGVTDRTLPAFDNEPCDGIVFHVHFLVRYLLVKVLIKIYNDFVTKDISLSRGNFYFKNVKVVPV
jgi:hypothetical protein